MPGPPSKVPRRLRILALMIVLLIVVGMGIVLKSNRGVAVVRSADGDVIRLEGYAFRRGNVRYDLPNRPIARALARVLPDSVGNRILPETTTVFAQPSFPGEPHLSVAFSARDSSGKTKRPGTRLVVLDDRGQEFDPVLNEMGNGGVFEVSAFPRRGRELRLRLIDGERKRATDPEKLVAEFKIPNPCPGPHPVWKPVPLPVIVTNAALQLTLESFVSDAAGRRTRCVFRVRENGRESIAWLPARFEVSDATGNHWRPPIDRPPQGTNGQVSGSFFGALWPEEDAWKLRVEFRPVDKQSNNSPACTVEFLVKPEQVQGERSL